MKMTFIIPLKTLVLVICPPGSTPHIIMINASRSLVIQMASSCWGLMLYTETSCQCHFPQYSSNFLSPKLWETVSYLLHPHPLPLLHFLFFSGRLLCDRGIQLGVYCCSERLPLTQREKAYVSSQRNEMFTAVKGSTHHSTTISQPCLNPRLAKPRTVSQRSHHE